MVDQPLGWPVTYRSQRATLAGSTSMTRISAPAVVALRSSPDWRRDPDQSTADYPPHNTRIRDVLQA